MGGILGTYAHITAQIEGKKVGPGSLAADLDMAMNDRNVGDMVKLWKALNEQERANLVAGFVVAERSFKLEVLFRLVQEDTSRLVRTLRRKAEEQEGRADAAEAEVLARKLEVDAWFRFMMNQDMGKDVMAILKGIGESLGAGGRPAMVDAAVKDLEDRLNYWEDQAEQEVSGLKTELAQAKDRITRWREDYVKLEAELATVREELEDSQNAEAYRAEVARRTMSLLSQAIQAQTEEDHAIMIRHLGSIADLVDGLDGKVLVSTTDHALGTRRHYLVDISGAKGDPRYRTQAAKKAAMAAFEEEHGAKASANFTQTVTLTPIKASPSDS